MAFSDPDFIGEYLNPNIDSFIDGSSVDLPFFCVKKSLKVKVNVLKKLIENRKLREKVLRVRPHFCSQVKTKNRSVEN